MLLSLVLLAFGFPAAGAHAASARPLSTGSAPTRAVGTTPPDAPSLQLGISVAPASLCAYERATCPAGTGYARVTLSASVGAGEVESWPAVQIAFVLETTPYDGVYDAASGDPGADRCAVDSQVLCEESNGVPFFVKNAEQIADEIQAANPRTQVSFALVDYFATLTDHDDGDGAEYHVDIAQFVPASDFGTAVVVTFQQEVLLGGWTYADSDLSDNILSSSSITALYGTLIGSGLDWSNDTHHVVVWMGSTCPRDPSCIEDYEVSPSDDSDSAPYSSSGCEPAYAFQTGTSPNCEGWVASQNGVASDSIAALAHTAPSCVDSVGGSCTIDTIDYWTTPTDAYSEGWPANRAGGGPGGPIVVQDVDRIIEAGCALADATGGTWDGPAGDVCPNGDTGTLEYVPYGTPGQINFNNPTLLAALARISFGPVVQAGSLDGANTSMFRFVPFGNIALPPGGLAALQSRAACDADGTLQPTCQTTATLGLRDGVPFVGFNWSEIPSENVIGPGDLWTASFLVVASGPPFATVPVDACTLEACRAVGSGAVDGQFSSATYRLFPDGGDLAVSFPVATVTVEPTTSNPNPPAFPHAVPPTLPPAPSSGVFPNAVPQLATVASTALPSPSLQGIAAGFLAAGFTRVSVRARAQAIGVALRSGTASRGGPPIGR
jgi:hypothetical protein